MSIIHTLNQFLWGGPVLLLLTGTHIFFTLKLKFPQKHTLKAIGLSVKPESVEGGKNLSGFGALATTLAATLGTGNIVGVSTAIAMGGPGALFWCWVTGVLGMATAYAECYLSTLFKQKKKDGTFVGGPMYVMEYGLGRKGLGKAYAFCTIMAALGIGCTTQANAISETLYRNFKLSPYPVGIVTAVITGLVIVGGIKSISKFCVKTVPVLGVFYIVCCTILLVKNSGMILPAMGLVVKSAFTTKAAMGGFIGSTMQIAMRYGIARGLFTNEAGIGTTAIAAAAAETKNPTRQGLISMTAVFWDTVVMCAMTGLVIITHIMKYPKTAVGCSPGSLTSLAFQELAAGGELFLMFALIAFALTTLIGWCYFGETAAVYLFGEKAVSGYHFIYIMMVFVGAIMPISFVWEGTDFINAIMVFPSVLSLFLLYGKIRKP